MWFPYSLPTAWKPECSRERVHESFADQSERTFLTAYQLRNPVAEEWSVELHLSEPQWRVQKDGSGRAVRVGYFPNDQERLSEIVCKLEDADAGSAVQRCHGIVSKLLSFWAADCGRGFAMSGFRIADLAHDARWRVLPHWPSAQTFSIPAFEDVPAGFWPLAELYREARTSSSDRYRFLCCHTILSKWVRGEAPFDVRDAENASRCVTQELMVISGMVSVRRDLEGTPLAELPDRLHDWREAALRFVLEGRTGAQEAPQSESMAEWAAFANLMDLAAHLVLSDSIQGFHRPAAETPEQPASAV